MAYLIPDRIMGEKDTVLLGNSVNLPKSMKSHMYSKKIGMPYNFLEYQFSFWHSKNSENLWPGCLLPFSLPSLGLVALGTAGIGNLIKFPTTWYPLLQIGIIHTIVGPGQT